MPFTLNHPKTLTLTITSLVFFYFAKLIFGFYFNFKAIWKLQNTYSNENRHLEYTGDCLHIEQEFCGASEDRGRTVWVEPSNRELRQP